MSGIVVAGKYELLRKLASGGMAEVFLARQVGLDGFEKLVVLKRILPHLAENGEFVRMFLDEARTAADLRHANIVSIFEVGEDQGTFFIAMEFLHGQDVRRVQRHSVRTGIQIPLQHSLQMVADAAAGLHYAHSKADLAGAQLGIVHRDISPQNIIVTYEGATKIVDFGIAKAASQSTETASGVLKGKYSYMSPEQASGHPIDARTDQFALGIVLYELTTMKRLFKRENEIMTLHAIIECEVPRPSTVVADYPAGLERIVMKALAKRPEDRYADCQGLQMALEDYMAERRLVSSPTRVGQFMKELFADKLESDGSIADMLSNDSQSGITWNPATRNTAASLVAAQPMTQAGRPGAGQTGVGTAAGFGQTGMGATGINQAGMTQQSVVATQWGGPRAAQVPDTAVTATGLAPGVQQGGGSRTGLFAAAAAIGLLALGGVGYMATQPGGADVTVRSEPAGATVFLDGEATGLTTPAVLHDVATGAHRIELKKDGFQSAVDVFRAGDDSNQVQLTLKAVAAQAAPQVTITSVPSGATVKTDDGTVLGQTPLSTTALPAGAHTLHLSAAGYKATDKRIAVEKDGASVAVTLVREKRATTKPTPQPKSGTTTKPRTKTTRKPASRQKGRLKIVVTPWAEVSVNGRRVGSTPMAPRKYLPGTYKVTLEFPPENKRVTKTIVIEPGKDTLIRHKW